MGAGTGVSSFGFFTDAASSATKVDKAETSICAEEVEAASFAAMAAAVFLLSSVGLLMDVAIEVAG